MTENGIPPGLTIRKTKEEIAFFDSAVGSIKKEADNLAGIYRSNEFLFKAQKKFEQDLAKEIQIKEEEHTAYINILKQQGYNEKELKNQIDRDAKEINKLRIDLTKEYHSAVNETQKNVESLKRGVDDSFKLYKDFQIRIKNEIGQLKAAGAASDEITAYLKKNEDRYQEASREMTSALEKVKDELVDLGNNENLSDDQKYLLKKQLRVLQQNFDLEEAHFNKQYKIFVEMNEDLNRLRESQEEADKKEKRQQKGKFKDTLLTVMLGPFRLLTDPINQFLHNNRDTYEQLSHKTEQKEEKIEIYEKSRKEINKLAEEKRESARLEALMSGADASEFAKPTITQAGMTALKASINPKTLLGGISADLGFGETSIEEYMQRANRQEAIGNLLTSVKKSPAKLLKGAWGAVFNKNKRETALASSPMLPSPISEESAIEQGHESLEGPDIMDKISPDQNTLLAKGGAVGAVGVFLAKKLGLITDDIENSKKKDKDGGLAKTAIDFMKKNGLGLLKVAAPLAVMAVGGAMIAGGMKMQGRDNEDSKKYFEERNTARGIETAILGDRARLTEENANRELGRTAGKSALLAGGAGLVAAGGAGTAAMIGTVASAGGIAAAGGLGAIGSAGIAALGTALPPALIAAAVVTAGMVVAKGTQEAFELGWDQNQAAIQKELTATMLSEDSSTIEKIKAGGASLWKGFTGTLAGGIREAGKVLDAETMIQQEKQIEFLKDQAAKGNEDYGRLLVLMQDEKFKAMSEADQKMMMKAEGVFDDYKKMRKETAKTPAEQLQTIGRTVSGFMSGAGNTVMEANRGQRTALWEAQTIKGLETLSGTEHERLSQSEAYLKARESGKNEYEAKKDAYLDEERKKAVARGDLTEGGMAVQEGNWLAGLTAGAAYGGVPGAIAGALGGAVFGKYMGFGDTGMAYKSKQSDDEYRQTFEYSKKKADLMGQGMSAEDADLAAIEEQNRLYEQAMTLRLKQTGEYKKTFDEQIKSGASLDEAEKAAVLAAKNNTRNLMTTKELVKDNFSKIGTTLGGWAKNIGDFFKEKFSAAGEGLVNLGNMIKEGAQSVWNAVSEWFSGIWHEISDKVKSVLGAVGEGWDWLKGKAGEGWDWLTGRNASAEDSAKINDGIVTKDGQVIEVSPDDNIYATKKDFKTTRDEEAQAAMPDVPRTPAEFSDTGIIAAIQILTDVLRNKDMIPQVVSQGESVNFDQFRMADVLT